MKFLSPRTLSIARKELRHVQRDPFTLGLALGLPLMMVVFFGYAINFDVRDIRVAVQDRDKSPASRDVTRQLSATGLFHPHAAVGGPADAEIMRDKVKGVLLIEPGFQKNLKRGETAPLQLLIDGSDNSSAGVIAAYVAGMVPSLNRNLVPPQETDPSIPTIAPVALRTRLLFNPELNSRWFVVPGLGVVILGLVATMLTAVTVAREWENGSMELLLSTPVKPMEIILGKLLPYLGLGFASVVVLYFCGRVLFGLPFEGSHLLYLLGCLLFLVPCLCLGLIISVTTRQQQVAMQTSMMVGMMPSLLLSGFVFPVESMPVIFQVITSILPARWFMVISRGLYLKGMTLGELWLPFSVLLVQNVLLLRLAAKKFKTDLEP
jgi:ABC-2 type transport system permease protein